MPSDQPNFHALLVGINAYANARQAPHLNGCVNDARNMERILRERFGVPPENIRVLCDEEATHAAILDAFRTGLIEKGKAWADAGRPDPAPAFLFYYSGHGSQAIDASGTEPDGLDETIVPHDSRTAGVYDIKDWELGQLLDELTRYSENVTVVLDCCHSGSGTRAAVDPTVARVRRCPPDLRPQPTQRPVPRRTRSVTPSNWELRGQYVLLAGCRDKELSHEHPVRDGDGAHWRGALSYFLQRELEEMEPQQPLLYRELYERVRAQVHTLYADQTPQCEGDLDRVVFGGLRPRRDAFYNVIDTLGGDVFQIDGGAVHGLSTGSLLRVYPAETRTLADAGPPLAEAEIVKCEAVTSWCERRGDGADVSLHARVVLHRYNYGNMRRQVLFAMDDPDLRDALIARMGPQDDITRTDVSAYIEPVTDGAADFQVVVADGRLAIQNPAGELLVAPFALDDLDGVAADLAHLVRYRNGLELRNPVTESRLAGAISLALYRLTFDAAGEPQLEELDRRASSELVAAVGESFVFEITNHADVPLYFALFDFSPDWEVVQIYPPLAGAHEPLQPNAPFRIGLARKPWEPRMEAQLPEGMAEGRDTFVVIASVQDTNFEALRMSALKLPYQTRSARSVGAGPPSLLDQLLAQAMNGGSTRAWGAGRTRVEDDWTTAKLEVVTVRAAQEVSRALVGGVSTEVPYYNLRVEAPPGFNGRVRVLTRRQSTRSVAGELVEFVEPPGLSAAPDRFQPVAVGATRAAGVGGAVVEIDADAASRQRVRPETPLTMELGDPLDADTDGLLAVAFDGSFFYPVGRSGDAPNRLRVEWLPEPEPPDAPPVRLERGLGRTIRLYLYKLLKREEPSLGLHRVRYVAAERADADPPHQDEVAREVPGGFVYYAPVAPGSLPAGQRVALAVHGFSSESRWLAAWTAGTLPGFGLGYDAVLAFDYETFATSIQESAATLRDELARAGMAENDGLHLDVFAHSQGTLVTRCLVELLGGNRFVDRGFLAGPPNRGTPLAEAKRLVPWLTTLALNQIAPGTASMIGGWVLKKVADDGAGAEDLRPGSPLLDRLNRENPEATVPYFILAGRNDLSQEARGVWERLQRKVMQGVDAGLDVLFGGQHDLVIGVNSMVGLRQGGYPRALVQVAEVPCNHFDYFAATEANARWRAWLS